ncbi:hypothetical protein [Bradyrhizobium sp. AZCC 2230]|uniref:hypothetical protein n=1 Tax=Bradyrhizobium sp. AZCC 2230 TaxID=3117021 RepID=UPI002FF3104A
MGRWAGSFRLAIVIVCFNQAIPAQHAAASPLDTATTLLTLAAWDPQRLIDDPPLANPSASDSAEFKIIRPCLRKIRAGYEAQLPALQRQYDILVRQVGTAGAKDSAAEQALNEATGFIRLMNISELAITNGSNLAASADFQINKGLIDALNQKIEEWRRLNPYAPNVLEEQNQKTKLSTFAIYRERLRAQCGL